MQMFMIKYFTKKGRILVRFIEAKDFEWAKKRAEFIFGGALPEWCWIKAIA